MSLRAPVRAATIAAATCAAAYYGGGSLTGTGQNIALLELAGTDLADLTTYYKNAKQTEPYTPTLISTGGYSTNCVASSGCDDTEQTIDMTQAMGMAPGSTTTMYVYGGFRTFDEQPVSVRCRRLSPLPSAISCSWSWTPADPNRRPLLQEICGAGAELLRGFWRQWFVPKRTEALSRRKMTMSWPSAARTYRSPARVAPGVRRPLGPTAAADFSGQHSDSFLAATGRRYQFQNKGSKTLRNVPDVAAEANFDFYFCADQLLQQPVWAGPVSRRRCGPATWLWSINRRLPTAIHRSAS